MGNDLRNEYTNCGLTTHCGAFEVYFVLVEKLPCSFVHFLGGDVMVGTESVRFG